VVAHASGRARSTPRPSAGQRESGGDHIVGFAVDVGERAVELPGRRLRERRGSSRLLDDRELLSHGRRPRTPVVKRLPRQRRGRLRRVAVRIGHRRDSICESTGSHVAIHVSVRASGSGNRASAVVRRVRVNRRSTPVGDCHARRSSSATASPTGARVVSEQVTPAFSPTQPAADEHSATTASCRFADSYRLHVLDDRLRRSSRGTSTLATLAYTAIRGTHVVS